MFTDKIKALRKHTNSAISIADKNGHIKYANDNFINLTGYSLYEILGNTFKIIRNKETPAFFYKQMWDALNHDQPWEGIIKNKKKSNERFIVKIKITPFQQDNQTYFLGESVEMTECVSEMEKYYHYHFDKLTGMQNRDIMIEEIIHKNSEPFQLALFDIDNFKGINDFYGYQSGDLLIKKISEIIVNHLDITDYSLYHISVDEFALVSYKFENHNDKSEFKEICESIIENIDNTPIKLNKSSIRVNLSCGLSVGTDVWKVLKEADMALSLAKTEHKAIIDFTKEDNLNKILAQKMHWLSEIKQALNNDTIVPWIQAIYDNKLNKIVKFEALMRLVDTKNNTVGPNLFLDFTKPTKLYEKVSMMMIEKTLEYFAHNHDHFNINISWEDVKSKKVTILIKRYLDYYDDLGERMTIELVESEGVENFNLFSEFINSMKNYGVSIALDDFGSGYSNFIYLDKIKADYIKIDGSLIQDMMNNDKTLFIVETLVSIAKKFDIKTVAEFVSSEEIYYKVKELGIDYSQGYFISEPRPINW